MMLLGEVALFSVMIIIILSLCLTILTLLSFRRQKSYFPRLISMGMSVLNGPVKIIWAMAGMEEWELTAFFIRLHNEIVVNDFKKIPPQNRAVFIPHCLRNRNCPARLTEEAIICKRCGRCEIGNFIDQIEADGTKVFIVPGSAFVKRLALKHKVRAVVGVGCLMEVIAGLRLADRIGIVSMGFVTLNDGCIETSMNWKEFVELMTGPWKPLMPMAPSSTSQVILGVDIDK